SGAADKVIVPHIPDRRRDHQDRAVDVQPRCPPRPHSQSQNTARIRAAHPADAAGCGGASDRARWNEHGAQAGRTPTSAGKKLMTKQVVLWAAMGGLLITLLKIIEYKHFVAEYSSGIYGGLVALIFTAIG